MTKEELKELRSEAGLSQESLAYGAGMNRVAIGQMETGTRSITGVSSFKIKLACMGGDASKLNRDQLLECISGLL